MLPRLEDRLHGMSACVQQEGCNARPAMYPQYQDRRIDGCGRQRRPEASTAGWQQASRHSVRVDPSAGQDLPSCTQAKKPALRGRKLPATRSATCREASISFPCSGLAAQRMQHCRAISACQSTEVFILLHYRNKLDRPAVLSFLCSHQTLLCQASCKWDGQGNSLQHTRNPRTGCV